MSTSLLSSVSPATYANAAEIQDAIRAVETANLETVGQLLSTRGLLARPSDISLQLSAIAAMQSDRGVRGQTQMGIAESKTPVHSASPKSANSVFGLFATELSNAKESLAERLNSVTTRTAQRELLGEMNARAIAGTLLMSANDVRALDTAIGTAIDNNNYQVLEDAMAFWPNLSARVRSSDSNKMIEIGARIEQAVRTKPAQSPTLLTFLDTDARDPKTALRDLAEQQRPLEPKQLEELSQIASQAIDTKDGELLGLVQATLTEVLPRQSAERMLGLEVLLDATQLAMQKVPRGTVPTVTPDAKAQQAFHDVACSLLTFGIASPAQLKTLRGQTCYGSVETDGSLASADGLGAFLAQSTSVNIIGPTGPHASANVVDEVVGNTSKGIVPILIEERNDPVITGESRTKDDSVDRQTFEKIVEQRAQLGICCVMDLDRFSSSVQNTSNEPQYQARKLLPGRTKDIQQSSSASSELIFRGQTPSSALSAVIVPTGQLHQMQTAVETVRQSSLQFAEQTPAASETRQRILQACHHGKSSTGAKRAASATQAALKELAAFKKKPTGELSLEIPVFGSKDNKRGHGWSRVPMTVRSAAEADALIETLQTGVMIRCPTPTLEHGCLVWRDRIRPYPNPYSSSLGHVQSTPLDREFGVLEARPSQVTATAYGEKDLQVTVPDYGTPLITFLQQHPQSFHVSHVVRARPKTEMK